MCNGLLADFVNKNQFNVVVRGLRGMSDFDSEQSMAQLHQHLYNDKTETVFLISDAKYAFISSTMAKQVIGLGGDGECLVPPCVLEKMKGRLNK
jgi:pantetheine-phosphate adenylyltransferase